MAFTLFSPAATPITLGSALSVDSGVLIRRSSSGVSISCPSLSMKWLSRSPAAPRICRYRKSLRFSTPELNMVADSCMPPMPTTVSWDREIMRLISITEASWRMAWAIFTSSCSPGSPPSSARAVPTQFPAHGDQRGEAKSSRAPHKRAPMARNNAGRPEGSPPPLSYRVCGTVVFSVSVLMPSPPSFVCGLPRVELFSCSPRVGASFLRGGAREPRVPGSAPRG